MNTSPRVSSVSPYKGHRFPPEIISHCVWLYFRFSLSFRDVEEMMVERGVVVSYESVREWCMKFGATYAKRIRAHDPRPGDRWHLDEVFLKIQGQGSTIEQRTLTNRHENESGVCEASSRLDRRSASSRPLG